MPDKTPRYEQYLESQAFHANPPILVPVLVEDEDHFFVPTYADQYLGYTSAWPPPTDTAKVTLELDYGEPMGVGNRAYQEHVISPDEAEWLLGIMAEPQHKEP